MKNHLVSVGALSVAAAMATQGGCGGSSRGFGGNGGDGAGPGGDDAGTLFGDDGGNDPCVRQGLASTTINGVVYDPAGKNPIYNVVVFVPSAPLKPFPAGVTCDKCGILESGSPIVSTLTDAAGKFSLNNVPPGDAVPLVMQIGKWRRKITVPHVPACQVTSTTDPSVMRLPAKQSEGDIPQFGIATGGADPFECLLRKIGIDDKEFTDPTQNGKVHLYQGSDIKAGQPAQAISASTPSAQSFWANKQGLLNYDMIINACEGSEISSEKPQSSVDNLVSYANAGGRLFNTHFQYFWISPGVTSAETSPWTVTGQWHGDQDANNDTVTDSIDDSFPKGKAFSEWLVNVGASSVPSQLDITQSRYEVDSVNAPALRWIYGMDQAAGTPAILHLTFNTPWNAADDKQCGKVLYSDFHVVTSAGGAGGGLPQGMIFPSECDAMPMSPQEKALEFMLFDLSSCIQNDTKPPQPPVQ